MDWARTTVHSSITPRSSLGRSLSLRVQTSKFQWRLILLPSLGYRPERSASARRAHGVNIDCGIGIPDMRQNNAIDVNRFCGSAEPLIAGLQYLVDSLPGRRLLLEQSFDDVANHVWDRRHSQRHA